MEREIEALCTKLLLKQQPVAADLRRITAALKMVTDLERIGDQASDIAEPVSYTHLDVYKRQRVDCDYYRFLAGDRREANAFRGEYMSNYSWAETTLGALTRKEGQGETGS